MPQLIKTIKTKNTSSLSLLMLIILDLGSLFFVIQGIGVCADKALSAGLPILLGNLCSLIISSIILTFKSRNLYYARVFQTTEKQFCENYEDYKLKVKMRKAEKNKVEVTQEEPQEPVSL